MSSEPRIALVTGGNKGIGREVCHQLGGLGYTVLLGSRDTGRGEAAAAHMRSGGANVISVKLDVTDLNDIAFVERFVNRSYGRLDVLVNNAAVYLDEGVSFLDVQPGEFEMTMQTNLYGPLYLCREFVPLMRRHNYGRIVNVSSRLGSLAGMGGRTGAYRISKAALNALTRVVAAETRGSNIKVNSVCPGWVRTDMGGRGAPRSVAEGADSIVWLATLDDDGPSGGFFHDRREHAW